MRIVQLVNNELAGDKLTLEDDLEKLINSDESIGVKKTKILTLLKEITLTDQAIKLWENYINPPEPVQYSEK